MRPRFSTIPILSFSRSLLFFRRWVYVISFSILFSFFYSVASASAAEVNTAIPRTPTLVSPNEWVITTQSQPLIQGIAESGNTIKVYFDNTFRGFTIATAHESGIGSFAFQTSDDLPFGVHTVKVVAVNNLGDASHFSRTVTFRIEPPFVAPKLTEITHTHTQKPYFNGIAANDSLIQVFIDDQLDGEFYVENHFSGTTSFTYEPFLSLRPGKHSIYLIAKNREGKSSDPTSKENFIVGADQKKHNILTSISGSVFYAVQSGDSLCGIAKRHYGNGANYSRIVKLNQSTHPTLFSTPNLIRVGWKLLIQ